jgi:5-amino-6-(5-phosphoribosylamino)uracil reductase
VNATPYTILSCAMSLDGYLDDASDERLVLSDCADLDRVDGQRAAADAILVGASTVRRDDPRLRVRDDDRRAARASLGLPPSPVKVTITRHGDLDPRARMFDDDGTSKLVYCASAAVRPTGRRLRGLATVVDAGAQPNLRCVVADLVERGVERLLVEGGATILTQFLADDLADELHLVVAPFFVGEAGGTPFVRPAAFPWSKENRARLVETSTVGGVALLRYALSERCATAPVTLLPPSYSLT